MPTLDRPVHRQAVSQESPSLRPEEVPLPGRLMHHRAEFLGALAAGQDTADQTLGTARTRLATMPFFRRLVLLRASVLRPRTPSRLEEGDPSLAPSLWSASGRENSAAHRGRGRLHGRRFDRFPRRRLWTLASDCLASALTAPIEFVAGPRRPTPSPPTGQERFGLATTSLAIRGSCSCTATAASRWSIRSWPIFLTSRSTGLGAMFKSDSSARSRDAC